MPSCECGQGIWARGCGAGRRMVPCPLPISLKVANSLKNMESILSTSPKLRVSRARKRRLFALLVGASFAVSPSLVEAQTTGTWNVNANGNWSAAGSWSGGIIPNAAGDIANFTNDINGTRTVTIDAAIPGSTVTLGILNFGDSNGTNSFVISGGTLILNNSGSPSQINMGANGNNNTISSAIQIVDPLVVSIADPSNSQGMTLNGAISGGVNGAPTITLEDTFGASPTNGALSFLILSGANTFQGQVVVNSGLLRYDGSNTTSYAGAVGVGNETIINDGGGVDLRDHDFNAPGNDTEIFKIIGTGPNGLGALRNTAGTAYLSHLELIGDALVNVENATLILERRQDASTTAGIAPILDFGVSNFAMSKLGQNDFVIRGVDVQNAAGASLNIYEGEVRFESRGLLNGTGASSTGIDLDGLTVNLTYNRNPYNNVDPTLGSRSTSDLFGVNINQTALQGNGVADARFSIGTYWGASVTNTGMLAEQSKETLTFTDMVFNFNNGVFQREGNGEAGRTFDHLFNNVTINLVSGGIGRDANGSGNVFDINGGSGSYNSVTALYDDPGVTEFNGSFDNTTGGNAGTGFTVTGSRELRLTGANAAFDGDVLVKRPTYRSMGPNYNTTSGAAESIYYNLSLAGTNGSLNQANSITITRWGSVGLLNNSANAVYPSSNNNDRINDGGVTSFRNGFLALETDTATANTENLGNVVADLGTNYIYLDTRAGGQFDGAFESLTRNNGGVLKIVDLNGAHTFGSGVGDDRIAINNPAGIVSVGSGAAGTTSASVVPGLFGGALPATFAARSGSAATRSDYTMQNAYAYGGSGLGLMTLDGGYLRPLTSAEYEVGGTPVAGTNWRVDRYVAPTGATTGDRANWVDRNVTADVSVNSLTIAFDATSSSQVVPSNARDYIVMEPERTLTVNSGIINFVSYQEGTSMNLDAVIRGGQIDMAGGPAIINSALSWSDTDRSDATWSNFLTGNSAYIRSHIINGTDLVKTGRNSVILETANELTGNLYVSEQGSLYARHDLAFGAGAIGREVQVGGAGNLLLDYGTNVMGINVRATNSFDTTRVLLRGEGALRNSWGGDVIIDGADGFGSASDAAYNVTARNNGTLTIYGNLYTANNQNLTDSDAYADPPVITTSIGESYTLNLRGQFRDVATGNLATDPLNSGITSVFRTGDSATRLDANHSLRFQMTGHDEGNVNVSQQWDATGRLDLNRGYFRILYDPATAAGAGGFYTDVARSLITVNDYFSRVVIGADGTSTTANDHAHISLTQDGQVFNAPYLYAYNNNRQGTVTIMGENTSGTVYWGSAANNANFSLQIANQNTEKDVRFLQALGGTMVWNGRLDDENGTTDSFNAVISIVGPGNYVFNVNSAGASDVDRWNFLAGETHWGTMTGNNQFARTRGTSTNNLGSISGWGGGSLVLDAQGTARTQTLDGNIYLFSGDSSVSAGTNTTFTMGGASPARSLNRQAGSSLAFLEDGGSINITATGLSVTAGDFLGTWATFGSTATGVTDWAGRQGTTGVQAFTGYSTDVFGVGNHTDLTASATLGASDQAETLRIGLPATLDVGAGNVLTLNQGGILIPATNTGDVAIKNGTVTSGWTAGSGDLIVNNYGQGIASISSVIANEGANKVNFVHNGGGTTVLQSDNTFTGDHYLNGGVVEISSDSQLGDVYGSIVRFERVNSGGNGSSTSTAAYSTNTGAAIILNTAIAPVTPAVTTFNSNTTVVTATAITSGGEGYSSGIWADLDDPSRTTENKAGVWAILDSGNLHFNGGTLSVTDDVSLNAARTIFLDHGGGTLQVAEGKTLTIDGYIASEKSYVSAANGYTTINHQGTVDEPASNRNPDAGDLTIEGGGTVVMRGAPDGTIRSNMFNTYGGMTSINSGTLRLGGAGSSGTQLLGTNRSAIDGTVIGANGTLELASTSETTIYDWLTVRGQGYKGGGSIRTERNTATFAAQSYNIAGQTSLESDLYIHNQDGSNVYLQRNGGDMFGSGDVIKSGTGILRFYGNIPDWTGALIANGGEASFYDVANVKGMTSMTLERNVISYYNADSTSTDEFRDRFNDSMPVYTDGYVRMRMDSTSGVFSGVEKLGDLTVVGGQAGIEYNLGSDIVNGAVRLTGDFGGWWFNEIIRSPGTTVNVRNFDAGTNFADASTSVTGLTNLQNRALLQVTIAPTMVGAGDGTNGDVPVIPGFFGGTRPEWFTSTTGQRFNEDYTSFSLMTVDTSANGEKFIRPLVETDYNSIAHPDAAQTESIRLEDQAVSANQNLRVVGVNSDTGLSTGLLTNRRNSLLTLGAHQTVNSLTFESTSYVDASSNPNGRGNYTDLILGRCAELTISSGMIVVHNTGFANWNGLAENTGQNLDIRSTIQGGRINMAGNESIFNITSIWDHYNTNDNVGFYDATDFDNNYLFFNSSLVNTTNIVKTGGASLFLQSPNFNTGDVYVNQGTLYARHDLALGGASTVYVQGAGNFAIGLGARIEGIDLVVGKIQGNNSALQLDDGSYWGGNVIIDNVDSTGTAGGFGRNSAPRIFGNFTGLSVIAGDIMGGTTPINPGENGTDARLFTTYTGAAGLLDLTGQIKDTPTGAITSLTDVTQVLRMEVLANNNEMTIQLNQPYDAAGAIMVKRGILRYNGSGDFYTPGAAAVVNADPLHPMLGLNLGGRAVVSGDGETTSNLSFFLANAGTTFNLKSWEVGVETYDEFNATGNDNYGRGNTTGNSTMGGENTSGEVIFGTGDGSVLFTQTNRQTVAYDRDLRLYSATGGEVTFRTNFLDGGSLVNSSITKIGGGTVNLAGSSAGDSTVESVNVLGGFLTLNNYGINANRRVGSGASLLLGGGGLVVDGSTAAAAFSEDFGAFTVKAGGSAIAAVGPNTTVTISGAPARNAGGTVHFQSIAGGTMNLSGVAASSRIGSYATFGANFASTPFATDWAATDAGGNIVAFTGYGASDVNVTTAIAGASVNSLRFDTTAGEITSGAIALPANGGILITSNYTTGTPIAAGVGVSASSGDLIIHNFASGDVTIAGDISGTNAVFAGVGRTILSGTNTQSGVNYLTGNVRLAIDDVARLGTGSLNMNGGTLEFTLAGAGTPGTPNTYSKGIILGGNNGTITVTDASSRLVLRGTATNQIVSEANVISSYGSNNPNSGGLTIIGPGTVQYGDRSAGTATQDILGVTNTYTGLTVIGDGVTPVTVDIQGQGNDNEQYTTFGTTDGWADGTIIRNNATLEISTKRGDGSRDNQIRFREWFQLGEQATDSVTILGSTQRQPTFDGMLNVVAEVTFNATGNLYGDAGSTGNSEFLINPNEGGVYGDGNIIKLGNGNLRFYRPLHEWTGDLDLRDGFTAIQANNGVFFESTGKIYMGETIANENTDNSSLQLRIENRGFGNSTTSIDSPDQDITINREIIVRDNLAHEVRIAAGYMPRNPMIHYTANINVGSGNTSTSGGGTGSINGAGQVRFYFEDTVNLDGNLVGEQQQTVFDITGNLSGSNNVMIDNNQGGVANQTDANYSDLFFTVWLRGDNTNFTGRLTVGGELGTGTGNFDRDDLETLRFGSALALTAANNVELRNLSTLQAGGNNVTIGNLITNDGNSTTGLYSFTSPTWDPTRQTTTDLDAKAGQTIDATRGTILATDYTPLGDSSAIVENGSATPGTLTITQTTAGQWDAYFRDGVVSTIDGDCTLPGGSLSIVKAGSERATMTIFNDYTGTTTVAEGNLQVGQNGNGEWVSVTQGSVTVATASGFSGVGAAGSTGTGATIVSGGTLSGSGHVRGNLTVNSGTLALGDNSGTYGPGGFTGTLFVGSNDVSGTSPVGNLTLNGGTMKFQVASSTDQDFDLAVGTYYIEQGATYTSYVNDVVTSRIDTSVNPSYFGEDGTTVSPSQHDHLEIGGNLVWDGTNIVVDADEQGYTPAAGDILNLIDWFGLGTNWGAFNVGTSNYLVGNGDDNGNLDLPDLSGLDPALRWDASLFTTQGILVVAYSPEPSRMVLMMLGLGLVFFRRRRVSVR